MQTKAVACVIVSYNNQEMLESLLQNLYAQTVKPSELFVIDNSSNDNSGNLVKDKFPQVQYFRCPTNVGSAGGFHEGIKRASQNNELVWLLDDDVSLPNDSLEQLLSGLERLEAKFKVGAVRSWYGLRCPFSEAKKVDTFAWRGTLITKKVIEEIGLPNPAFFLYADDTEYALRMVKKGFAIFWIPTSIVLERREDDRKRLRLFGIYARVYEDKAKLYYAFRNQTYLSLRYGLWLKLFKTFLYASKVIFLIWFITKNNRREKIKAIMRGLRDGLRSRLGKNPLYTQ